MSLEIKYKLGDLAKDLGAASKDIIEMLSALEKGEAKKHTTPLAENELNLVLEQMTKNAQEDNFDAYFATAAAAKKKEEKQSTRRSPLKRPGAPRRRRRKWSPSRWTRAAWM